MTAAIVVPVFLVGAIVIVLTWQGPPPATPDLPESPCVLASPENPTAGPNKVSAYKAIPYGRAPRSWTAFGPQDHDPQTASVRLDLTRDTFGGRPVMSENLYSQPVQVVICGYRSPDPATNGTCTYVGASSTPLVPRSSPPSGPRTVLAKRDSAYTLLAFEAVTNRLLARVDTRATECPAEIAHPAAGSPPSSVLAVVDGTAVAPINRLLDGP